MANPKGILRREFARAQEELQKTQEELAQAKERVAKLKEKETSDETDIADIAAALTKLDS